MFHEGKLDVGQEVLYLPLHNIGVTAKARIFKKGGSCLQLPNSDEKFSFSGLRGKFIKENNLSLNPYFPYNQWGEWELQDPVNGNKKLSEL
jgi:hypothetical protein